MSVLKCNRRGCENILCDMYSYTYGYICDECFAQLLLSNLTIESFMDTVKTTYSERADWEEDLNKEFVKQEKSDG